MRKCEGAKLRAEPSDRQGEVMTIATFPVVTAELTTPVYDVVHIMAREGFRRIPVVNPRTRRLQGIVTSRDMVDYLGGGNKFAIIARDLDGSFFKAINEPVKSIMRPNPPTVESAATITRTFELMQQHRVGGLPVVNDAHRIVAIVTERNLLPIFARRAGAVTVGALMTGNVVTGTAATTIIEAEKVMVAKSFRRLPLVSEGRLVGIVTAMDIVRFFGLGAVFQHLRSGTILQVLQTPALQIGTNKLFTVSPDTNVNEAAKTMQESKVGALLVVDDAQLVGILTERDFFKVASA